MMTEPIATENVSTNIIAITHFYLPLLAAGNVDDVDTISGAIVASILFFSILFDILHASSMAP